MPWSLILSIPLAIAVGYAIRRGSICAVAGVERLLDRRDAGLFLNFLQCGFWVLLVTLPLAWLIPGFTPAPIYPLTWNVILGGVIFGIGTVINGGCAFSTLSRLGAGDLTFALTIMGMVLGFSGRVLFIGPWPDPIGPSLLAQPTPGGAILLGGLSIWAVLALTRKVRSGRLRGAMLEDVWDPGMVVMVIGIAGGLLYALNGSWNYTAVLQVLLTGFQPQEHVRHGVLLLAVLAGAGLAARDRGYWHFRWSWGGAMQRLPAGLMMGFGAAMIPGGNDGLILRYLPALSPHALPAYAAIVAGAAATILLRRAYRKHRAPSPAATRS